MITMENRVTLPLWRDTETTYLFQQDLMAARTWFKQSAIPLMHTLAPADHSDSAPNSCYIRNTWLVTVLRPLKWRSRWQVRDRWSPPDRGLGCHHCGGHELANRHKERERHRLVKGTSLSTFKSSTF